MALYGNVPTATASVGANTNLVTIVGLDLTTVTPGMTINLGARDRKAGDAWIIGAVTPSGTNGGTLATQGSIPTAYNSIPFIIDTTGYLGTDASYAAAVGLAILNTLAALLGVATNLYSGARQLVMDKASAAAVSRFVFSIAGRAWGAFEHRTLPFTPTGGQATNIETLAVRAAPDGTTWTDALLLDLTNGTGDLRKGLIEMASAATVDLGSAPAGRVAITGSASIASFGSGRNLQRLVHFVNGGGTLTHNGVSLALPGGASIVTRGGDRLLAASDSAGNWLVYDYIRGDGTPLVLPVSTQRASFRRRNVNGDFSINQRAVSGTVTLAAGQYAHDGWKAGAGGCTYTFSSSGVIVTLNITAGSLVHVVDGGSLPEGGTYTLSWVGGALGRAYQGSGAGAYAAGPITLTGLPPAASVTLEFGTGVLGLVQFEPGPIATPFEIRDDELRRCRRRLRLIKPAGAQINFQPGNYADSNSLQFIVPFDGEPMAFAPSAQFMGQAGSGYYVSSQGQSVSGFGFVAGGISDRALIVVASKNGHGLAGGSSLVNFVITTGGILLSAEL